MKKISVYDPAMCCPTGVCGPSVDPKLAAFSADLDWLTKQGVEVERYNLAQQPQAFADSRLVTGELQKDADCLPLVVIDEKIVACGCYPDRATLAKFFGMDVDGVVQVMPSCGCKPGNCC